MQVQRAAQLLGVSLIDADGRRLGRTAAAHVPGDVERFYAPAMQPIARRAGEAG